MTGPRFLVAILTAAALAAFPACDTKVSSSPTEPIHPFFKIGLLDAPSPVLLQNVAGEATIIAVSVYLDGTLLYASRDLSPRPSERLPFAFYPSSLGAHTLKVFISNQTSSPPSYSLPDFHVILATKVGSTTQAIATVALPARTRSLATDASFDYQFSF